MNRKDIKTDQVYAAVLSGTVKPHRTAADYNDFEIVRVRVVQVHDKDQDPTRYGEKNKIVELVILQRWDNGKLVNIAGDNRRVVPVRRIMQPWDKYIADREKLAGLRRTWAQENAERVKRETAQAEQINAKVSELGLQTAGEYGYPLFEAKIYSDGSSSFKFNGEAEHIIALLDRLQKAEAQS